MEFKSNIKEIEKKIGYTFKDKSLLTQAFTRTSFCNEHKGAGGAMYQSNEVLEFFGDSVLSAAIVTLLMRDFSKRYDHGISTKLNEGDFSNIKSRLSDKKNLSERIKELGLQRYLRMGEGDSKLGIADEPSVMEDLFESIVGAVYIDSSHNMTEVISLVARMLDVSSYLSASTPPIQSHKNALQEFCADKKRRMPPPVYKTVSESGPEHKKIYERACYIGDKLYATGSGKNQKLADSAAAEATLKLLLAEEKRKNTAEPSQDSILKLREYAKANKKTLPHFKDLGESDASTDAMPEYRVACIFAEREEVGLGTDKSKARCAAAEKMLKALLPKPEKKQEKKPLPPRKDNKKPKKQNSARLHNNKKIKR